MDHFLVSNTITVNAEKAEIRPPIAPDHKAIFLSFEIQGELRGDLDHGNSIINCWNAKTA